MNGGGTWKTQNKILNGTYINFVSNKKNAKVKHVVPNNPIPDNPVVSEISSVLGVAILGKMILGEV